MSRQLKFWCTEAGRTITLGFVTFGGAVAVGSVWAPNTYLQNYLLPAMQYHRLGKPVTLSEKLKEKFDKCLELLEVPEGLRRYLKPFIVYGFDSCYTGSIFSKFGSNLGYPLHYEYESTNDIDTDMEYQGKYIDWSSDAGLRMAKSLVLTDNEKMFGLCREIFNSQSNQLHFNCFYPGASLLFVYAANTSINAKFNNYYKPFFVRFAIYTVVSCFGLGLYFMMRDFTNKYYERKADERLAELGDEFIAAGASFYGKILDKNKALRELIGPEDKFSTLGNENFLFRQRSLPILTRKQYFESLLNEKSK